ncbi:hypothetical protein [Sulfurovum sp. NBC37-1]|uniref:hypothetical protein n=1 Tax=Sulfurovum sp. (strain NBC37-1) TaxID=387093 RepID=UPI0001587983|nr:hypothetical protein [Sulfurovum sp. NBC37-1]BAF73242.1 hypothetical protein SUN_2303 [Sulfurovum sp. NBC37-1]
MNKKIENIRIEWDGPYSLTDIGYDETNENYKGKVNPSLCNEYTDFGIYQVYGYHPIYGNDVLLYIGQSAQQTFSKRLSQEGWEFNADSKNIKFYVGRLFAKKQPSSEKEWDKMIDIAERMLIYAHEPARNSSNILSITRNRAKLKEFENIRIFNYDNYRSLIPEISGELWVKDFEDYNGVFNSKEI